MRRLPVMARIAIAPCIIDAEIDAVDINKSPKNIYSAHFRWRYRLGVRTEDSQSSNPGSIPGSATISYLLSPIPIDTYSPASQAPKRCAQKFLYFVLAIAAHSSHSQRRCSWPQSRPTKTFE